MADPIWPTWIYHNKVKEHDKIYEAFLPYLNDSKYFSKPWTFGSCESSLRTEHNEEFPWRLFFETITPYVNEHLVALDPVMPYNIHTDEYWVNMYHKGDHQEVHDHVFPGRAISAVYVLEMPEGEREQIGGELVFENTNFPIIKAAGLNRIFNKWQCQHIMPMLEPGTLVLFPSWIPHYVLPSKTDQRRSSIAVNFSITEAHDQINR